MVIACLRPSPLDGERECYLDAIYVDPAARGRGIAERLLEAVRTWADGRGARRTKTFVSATNERMLRWCKARGFRPVFIELERRDS